MQGNKESPARLLMRAWRLLALAAAFFALGAAFFFWHQQAEPVLPSLSEAPVQEENAPVRHVKGPEPSVFKTFTYRPEEPSLEVSGSCSDVYYTVLIYPRAIDYRESPLDAKYNTALPCPASTEYARSIDLSALPLITGEQYYVIRAELGERGQWYNAQ